VNNVFNAETASSSSRGPLGGGERTEVIQRGGSGAFHGNFMSMFQDDILNARNPFAANKPPYYQRTINGNFSGPMLRDRLTVSFTVNDSRAENVGTVKAQLPEGPFSLGITRPTVAQFYEGRGIVQLADAHSLHFGFNYGTENRRNQNIGDFTLPERGSNSETRNHAVDLRQISVLSERAVHEVRFSWKKNRSETSPITSGVAINVLDAFSGGGGQNHTKNDSGTYEFGNLLYYVGRKVTLRSGFSGSYLRESSLTENNMIGEFTFSDLESYRNRKPFQYRVTVGNPLLDLNQLQVGAFIQNDISITNRFSLYLGLRYETQSNMHDRNNLDPRIAFAYAIGGSTVLRGGAGLFHGRTGVEVFRTLARLNGTRQYETFVDQPGWPDPFVTGNTRLVPPSSRRVIGNAFANQIYYTTALTVEHSFPWNLFVSIGGDYNRQTQWPRSRNINAPSPDTHQRPFPNEGNVFVYESNGVGDHENLKINVRQRFSIFSLTGSYILNRGYNDDAVGGDVGTQGNGFAVHTDPNNLQADWGRAAINPTHQFSAGVNSKLPFDVYLNTAIAAKSGSMYNITTGKDDNGDGVANDRPPGAAKFSATGPHFFNISFNISKAVRLTRTPASRGTSPGARDASAGPQMNVFANLNNAFNMTHPGTPSGVMTSPFFGKSFNAASPREVEVGMRFQF
jgi:hypothetical protein